MKKKMAGAIIVMIFMINLIDKLFFKLTQDTFAIEKSFDARTNLLGDFQNILRR